MDILRRQIQRASQLFRLTGSFKVFQGFVVTASSMDLKFSSRRTAEAQAMRVYHAAHHESALPCVYRDYKMIPPEDVEGYINAPYELNSAFNNYGYGFVPIQGKVESDFDRVKNKSSFRDDFDKIMHGSFDCIKTKFRALSCLKVSSYRVCPRSAARFQASETSTNSKR